MQPETVEDCLRAARNLLSIREHSKWELARKLSQRRFSKAVIAESLNALEEEGSLSETRYLREKVRSLILKNYGPSYIELYLKERGLQLPQSLLMEVYDQLDLSPEQQIKNFLERNSSLDTQKVEARLWRRGFKMEHIRNSLKDLEAF
ncbi:MAG: regulatory protein RecX [Bradymonadales bacterium]|nr:MAG: regulatory protein RecX [Bradymonadales bacterium]